MRACQKPCVAFWVPPCLWGFQSSECTTHAVLAEPSGNRCETRFSRWSRYARCGLAGSSAAAVRSVPRRVELDRYDLHVTDRLFFTDDDAANRLLADEPMALLIGFLLDQQVTVQKAFSGPLAIRERVGTLDAGDARRRRPRRGLPREARDPPLPGRDGGRRCRSSRRSCATSTAGDAARRLDRGGRRRRPARSGIGALPGFGDMKIKSLGSVLCQALRRQGRRGPACPPTPRSATSTHRRRWRTTRPRRSCTKSRGWRALPAERRRRRRRELGGVVLTPTSSGAQGSSVRPSPTVTRLWPVNNTDVGSGRARLDRQAPEVGSAGVRLEG